MKNNKNIKCHGLFYLNDFECSPLFYINFYISNLYLSTKLVSKLKGEIINLEKLKYCSKSLTCILNVKKVIKYKYNIRNKNTFL